MDRMVGRRRALARGDASRYAITGPLLRAAGVPLRRAPGAARTGPTTGSTSRSRSAEDGDNYDRYLVRMAEMEQSMRIAEQALGADARAAPINVDFEGRPIDPAAYVDRGKQGKTEGLLLIADHALAESRRARTGRPHGRVNAPDKRVVLPPKETAYGSIEGLMNHFMLVMEGYGIRPPRGRGVLRRRRAPTASSASTWCPTAATARTACAAGRRACRRWPRCHRMIEGEMIADIDPDLRLGQHDRRGAGPMTARRRPKPPRTAGSRPRQQAQLAGGRGGCRRSIRTSAARCCPCCTWPRRPSARSRSRSRSTWRACSSSRRPTCTRSSPSTRCSSSSPRAATSWRSATTCPATCRGAEDIVDHLKERLGIEAGETTADGRVTLQSVECLCACEAAPMVQVDDRYEGHLTPEKVDRILEGLR